MSRLLHAGFRRLWRDRLFWIFCAATALISLGMIWSSADSYRATTANLSVSLDNYFYNLAPLMGLFFTAWLSLFSGGEDAVLRNKLMVGHTRPQIYLSGFLVCLAADLVLLALWIVFQLPGLFLIGPLEMGLSGFLTYLAVAVGFTFCLTAIVTLIQMLCNRRVLAMVLCLALWLCLLLLGSGINDRLCEPATYGGMVFVDGQLVPQPPEPNPLYVAGTARLVLECILDALPTGQAILMSDAKIVHPMREVLFSLALTAALLAAGIRAFRKKDLK